MTDRRTTVLVADDEAPIRRALRGVLTQAGYDVVLAEDGSRAVDAVALRRPDAVLMDLMMPALDGFEATRRIRQWSAVPIIVLSVRGDERDKVDALDLGADDYLVKPFGTAELLARLRAALRHRPSDDESSVFRCGEIEVDYYRRIVTLRGEEARLTRTEYELLALLTRHAGRVLTHRMLLREVWGPEYVAETHYLRVFIAQLRRKLEDDPANPTYILTELGVGYRFRAPES